MPTGTARCRCWTRTCRSACRRSRVDHGATTKGKQGGEETPCLHLLWRISFPQNILGIQLFTKASDFDEENFLVLTAVNGVSCLRWMPGEERYTRVTDR